MAVLPCIVALVLNVVTGCSKKEMSQALETAKSKTRAFTNSAVEAVEVTWPATGETQRFTQLEMDRYYSIREGEPDPVEHEPRSFKLVAGPGVRSAHEQHH